MAYIDNQTKFVCVLNPRTPLPRAMNALAHAILGLGATIGPQAVEVLDYRLADQVLPTRISRFPVIILQAKNGNQLRSTFQAAGSAGISVNLFTDTMIGCSADDQIERTGSTRLADADPLVLCLFGTARNVDALTRRFSLFKASASGGNNAT